MGDGTGYRKGEKTLKYLSGIKILNIQIQFKRKKKKKSKDRTKKMESGSLRSAFHVFILFFGPKVNLYVENPDSTNCPLTIICHINHIATPKT